MKIHSMTGSLSEKYDMPLSHTSFHLPNIYLEKVKKSLMTLREKNDARGCLGVLETCIRSNFAGVESARYTFGLLTLIPCSMCL